MSPGSSGPIVLAPASLERSLARGLEDRGWNSTIESYRGIPQFRAALRDRAEGVVVALGDYPVMFDEALASTFAPIGEPASIDHRFAGRFGLYGAAPTSLGAVVLGAQAMTVGLRCDLIGIVARGSPLLHLRSSKNWRIALGGAKRVAIAMENSEPMNSLLGILQLQWPSDYGFLDESRRAVVRIMLRQLAEVEMVILNDATDRRFVECNADVVIGIDFDRAMRLYRWQDGSREAPVARGHDSLLLHQAVLPPTTWLRAGVHGAIPAATVDRSLGRELLADIATIFDRMRVASSDENGGALAQLHPCTMDEWILSSGPVTVLPRTEKLDDATSWMAEVWEEVLELAKHRGNLVDEVGSGGAAVRRAGEAMSYEADIVDQLSKTLGG